MNYFHIPGLNRTEIKQQLKFKNIMASISLNREDRLSLESYAKVNRLSSAKVIRKALMAYGVIETKLIKRKKPIKIIDTIYYDVPRDEIALNIATIVCKVMGVDIRGVYCNRRYKQYTMAKHCIRYWIRQETDYTLELVGLLTCKTDHSTVLHSVTTWGHMVETNKRYRTINDSIKSKLL